MKVEICAIGTHRGDLDGSKTIHRDNVQIALTVQHRELAIVDQSNLVERQRNHILREIQGLGGGFSREDVKQNDS